MINDIMYYYILYICLLPGNRHSHARKIFSHSMPLYILEIKTLDKITLLSRYSSNLDENYYQNYITNFYVYYFSHMVLKKKNLNLLTNSLVCSCSCSCSTLHYFIRTSDNIKRDRVGLFI